ncbi:MAG: ATP-dependent Clp protease adaptor ClpS [Flavobacteriia bacterium]|jgi:ATP-dependent Clp protease adaptor protein ClpS
MTETQYSPEIETLETLVGNRDLIVYNDDVNTFDHVIDSFVKICKHDSIQAEQCAYIIHFNGKCQIKSGTFDELEPFCTALLDRGLSAEIQ